MTLKKSFSANIFHVSTTCLVSFAKYSLSRVFNRFLGLHISLFTLKFCKRVGNFFDLLWLPIANHSIYYYSV